MDYMALAHELEELCPELEILLPDHSVYPRHARRLKEELISQLDEPTNAKIETIFAPYENAVAIKMPDTPGYGGIQAPFLWVGELKGKDEYAFTYTYPIKPDRKMMNVVARLFTYLEKVKPSQVLERSQATPEM